MNIRKIIYMGTLLTTIVVVFLAMTTGAIPTANGNAKNNKEINTDNYKVGDIIAEGTRGTGDLCNFDDFKVKTTASDDGKTNWVSIKFDKQCRAIIKAKWHGSLEEGPQDVIEPILNSTPAMTIQDTQEPALLETKRVALSATTGSKTSQQSVYTYGYGSPWFDVLTKQVGTLTFSYDGTNARKISHSTQYYGADWTSYFGWKWVLDSGLESVNQGPSPSVWLTSRGSFHCSPSSTFPCSISDPDGYYHSLYTDESGYADGTSYCIFWKTGNVVLGPNRDILQGCS